MFHVSSAGAELDDLAAEFTDQLHIIRPGTRERHGDHPQSVSTVIIRFTNDVFPSPGWPRTMPEGLWMISERNHDIGSA